MRPLADQVATTTTELDSTSSEWLRTLRSDGPEREAAVANLHELLLRVARHEVRRRSRSTPIVGAELDDLAHQAVADAIVTILGKLDTFRGESRFTTWAYTFAVFEVSGKLTRHQWNRRPVWLAAEDWGNLPERFGLDPSREAEWGELVAAVHRAVGEVLTDHQRRLFVAVVLHGVPLDVLVVELGVPRNTIYKVVFDARRKIRAELVRQGLVDPRSSSRSS